MRSGMIGLLLGLLAGAALEPSPPTGLLVTAALLFQAGLFRRYQPIKVVLLCGLLGWLWSGWGALQQRQSRLPEALARQDLRLQGRIVGLLEPRQAWGQDGVRFEFVVEQCQPLHIEHTACSKLQRILLSWYGGPLPRSGETWQLTVRLKPPHGLQNPGGFDYARYLYQRGIDATGYVRQSPPAERLAAAAGWTAWRAQWAAELKHQLKGFAQARWLRALALGDQRGLTDADWELLKATGTVHLFVVSGLHISLVGGLVWAVVRIVTRLWPAPVHWSLLAIIVAWLAATTYAVLAGWGLPAQRAWLMFSLGLLIAWHRRQVQPLTALLGVAVAVLLLQPSAIWSQGFWLSFTAVAAILMSVCGRRLRRAKGRGFLSAQWAVWLGLLVPLLLWGGPLAPVALPANLLAVPLTTALVVPLNLLAVLCMNFWPEGAAGLWLLADGFLRFLQEWLQTWVEWQGNGWLLPERPAWVWGLALLGSLTLLLPRGWPGKSLGVLLLLPALTWQPELLPEGEWRATVIDVGQGLAVLVETRHHRLLYDAGPRLGTFDTGRLVVVPYLVRRNVSALDLLMVSHGDSDHSGGALAVMAALPVKRVLSGEPVAGVAPASRCRAGQHWTWDGVRFSVLLPDRSGATGNAASCVLVVDNGRHRLLLTGDIGYRQELKLLPIMTGLEGAVVVAPHHGSRSSSSATWVAALKPAWGIFSAGRFNRFNHPDPTVVERYQTAGARLWNTAEQGAVSLVTARGEIHVETP